MNTGITTIRKCRPAIKAEALERAETLHLPYFQRENMLSDMAQKYGMEGFLVYGKKLPYYWSGGEEYRFHLGTSVLRIEQMKRGNQDRLCSLLPEGHVSVLDATFGQGGDSMTMSWFLGERGNVTSLEKSTPLYEIGRSAISGFTDSREEELVSALHRITLLHEDFKDFLRHVEPKSFDVIYFDTMFRAPVKRKENHMEGFRNAACYDWLDGEIIRMALHIAGKRIIVKERPFSILFSSGIFSSIHARKGQTTAYGVIDV